MTGHLPPQPQRAVVQGLFNVILYQKWWVYTRSESQHKKERTRLPFVTDKTCKSLSSCATPEAPRAQPGLAEPPRGCSQLCSPWRQKCWAGTSHSLSRGTFQHILSCKHYPQGSTLNRIVLPLLHTSQLIIQGPFTHCIIAPPGQLLHLQPSVLLISLLHQSAAGVSLMSQTAECLCLSGEGEEEQFRISQWKPSPANTSQEKGDGDVETKLHPHWVHNSHWDIFSSQPRLVFKGVKCHFYYSTGCKRSTQKPSHCWRCQANTWNWVSLLPLPNLSQAESPGAAVPVQGHWHILWHS